MLKRTMILLSLTASVSALLLVAGCGGAGSNPITSISSDVSNGRGWRDSMVTLVVSSPAVVKVTDPDGISSITVRDSKGGRNYYFPNGATEFQFELKNFGQVDYHVIGIVDGGLRVDSTWIISKEGTVTRR